MTDLLMDSDGKRKDGRGFDVLRPINIKAGVLENADGSAYIEWGNNKIMVGVYGPREMLQKHLQRPDRAVIQVQYSMAPFSVEERKKPGQGRRENEISKVLSEALEAVVLSNSYPRTSIDVYIEVLEAGAGTRCAGLTAASVAMADAGIPMKGMITACAAGKIDGRVVVDLDKLEDNIGDADLPIGLIPTTGEIVLMQMDGHLTKEEFETAFSLVKGACSEIHQIQRDALFERHLQSGQVGDVDPNAEEGSE